ncbi:unnamed protein product [Onchocerca flexuosa]|uniref:C2H2-type domain-containing protein n=1 Tax=Onchocerca flexuosa TaxID=387005 RepID=A0A183H6S0_9BILA|nr:unnamed protein product [Onchocerca flexuosa]
MFCYSIVRKYCRKCCEVFDSDDMLMMHKHINKVCNTVNEVEMNGFDSIQCNRYYVMDYEKFSEWKGDLMNNTYNLSSEVLEPEIYYFKTPIVMEKFYVASMIMSGKGTHKIISDHHI